jgi:ferritin-like metal-binding protein YciE
MNKAGETTMASKEEHLISWLQDAHAMEGQAIESTERQIKRLENYPEVRGWVEEHVAASRRQREAIKACIERRGGSTSTIKDTAMSVFGWVQEFSGTIFSDEVLKNVIADYALKHYEIGSYNSLKAAASEAGDLETEKACAAILDEEQALAQRLQPLISQLTVEYLRRDAAAAPKKR